MEIALITVGVIAYLVAGVYVARWNWRKEEAEGLERRILKESFLCVVLLWLLLLPISLLRDKTKPRDSR